MIGKIIIPRDCWLPTFLIINKGAIFKRQFNGLGMMVVFRVIESMNGSINIESEQGKRIKISLHLPLSSVA
jgi:signal transduction histidine kinase